MSDVGRTRNIDYFELIRKLFSVLASENPWYILVNGLATAVIIYCAQLLVINDAKSAHSEYQYFEWKRFVNTLVISSMIYTILCFLRGWGGFLLTFTSIFFFLWSHVQTSESGKLLSGLVSTWQLFKRGARKILLLQLKLQLVMYAMLVAVLLPVFFGLVILAFMMMWVWVSAGWKTSLKEIVMIPGLAVSLVVFYMIVTIMAVAAGRLYYALREIQPRQV